MKPLFPVEDLSYLPDDWLEAFLFVIDEDGGGEDRFAAEIEAIYRMRDIQLREGRSLHAYPEAGRVSAKAGWAELRTDDDVRSKRHPLPLPADFRLIGWGRANSA